MFGFWRPAVAMRHSTIRTYDPYDDWDTKTGQSGRRKRGSVVPADPAECLGEGRRARRPCRVVHRAGQAELPQIRRPAQCESDVSRLDVPGRKSISRGAAIASAGAAMAETASVAGLQARAGRIAGVPRRVERGPAECVAPHTPPSVAAARVLLYRRQVAGFRPGGHEPPHQPEGLDAQDCDGPGLRGHVPRGEGIAFVWGDAGSRCHRDGPELGAGPGGRRCRSGWAGATSTVAATSIRSGRSISPVAVTRADIEVRLGPRQGPDGVRLIAIGGR